MRIFKEHVVVANTFDSYWVAIVLYVNQYYRRNIRNLLVCDKIDVRKTLPIKRTTVHHLRKAVIELMYMYNLLA